MVAAFGMSKDSKLATLLIITAVQAVSIWNIGIKTAAAQNLVAVGFINEAMGEDIFGFNGSFTQHHSQIMSILLYFVMTRFFKAETDEIWWS